MVMGDDMDVHDDGNDFTPEQSRLNVTLATGAVTLGALALAPAAMGATFTVNKTTDDGSAGTLRWAVGQANVTPGADVVNFDPTVFGTPQTITLYEGALKILDSVTVQGPGARLTIDADHNDRAFYIYSQYHNLHTRNDVTLSNLTITNGSYGSSSWGGGAVVDWGDNLTLDHVTITNSKAYYVESTAAQSIVGHAKAEFTFGHGAVGGAVAKFAYYGGGFLHIKNSTISGNTANSGGGVYVDPGASSYIKDSLIQNNTAYYQGGGISLSDPAFDLLVQRTLIDGNSAYYGGGLSEEQSNGGRVTVDSSTISHNSAQARGGGASFYEPRDAVAFINSTVAKNDAAQFGGGLYFHYAPAGSGVNFTTIASNTVGVTLVTPGHKKHRGAHASASSPRARASAKGTAGGIFLYETYSEGRQMGRARTNGTPTYGFNVTNSVIANNQNYDTQGGTFVVSYSLIRNPDSSNISDGGHNLAPGTDPLLGPLQSNGGPAVGDYPATTPTTMMPAPSSPLIDAANGAGAPNVDERQYGRPAGPAPDIGAVEVGGAPPLLVPTLGTFGKILLALTTMITGLFMTDRKRFLGALFAGTVATLIVSTSMSAQMVPKAHGHAAKMQTDRYVGTLDSMATKDGNLTMSVGGRNVTIAAGSVQFIDARSEHRQVVSAASLHTGANVVVLVQHRRNGTVHARVRLVNAAVPH